jgi:TRAP-type C4-dicarboxylate transport system permease small subunit
MIHFTRQATRSAALVGSLVLGALAPLTALDVALRYFLNAPIRGAFELTELAMVGVIFLGLGEAQLRREHITIDLVHERLGPRGRRALDRCARLVSLLTVATLAWQLSAYMLRVQVEREVSGVLAVPTHLAVAVAAIGSALFAVALGVDR